MRRNPLVLIVSLALILGGCASLSNYQTAEVLKEDESKFILGLTFTDVSPEEGAEIDYEDVMYFTPELLFRTGVTDRFDFGGKIYFSLPVGVVVDGKYQFVDSEKFDMAADIGVGYTGVEVGDEDLYYIDFYPAVLMTYNVSEKFSATLAPKVIIRRVEVGDRSDTQTLAGATFTLAVGKKGGRILPEFGYYIGKDSLDQDVEFLHWGIGFGF